jgi:hypothetical protein
MKTPVKKPTQLRVVLLEGKLIGAIMLDEKGYFYRPKRNSITSGPHSEKWDGEHFPSDKACERSVYGEE